VIEIWDYKGSKRPSARHHTYQDHIFQMQVYAELYRRKTGVLPNQGTIYFLGELGGRHPPRTTPINAKMIVEFDAESITQGIAAFDRVVDDIEGCLVNGVWPDPASEPPGGTCVACDLRWNCQATRNFGNRYRLRYP
jgi:hypothetical protein